MGVDVTKCRCWDGKNVDSPDHKSHVAYPSSGTFESSGPCPSTHPVKLPQVMYEVIWDTREFNDKSIWPTDGTNPLVYSMGDGYALASLLYLKEHALTIDPEPDTDGMETISLAGRVMLYRPHSMSDVPAMPARA
jgi:hypothetical protein